MNSSNKNKKKKPNEPKMYKVGDSLGLVAVALAWRGSGYRDYKEFLITEMGLCELDAWALAKGGKYAERAHLNVEELEKKAQVYAGKQAVKRDRARKEIEEALSLDTRRD